MLNRAANGPAATREMIVTHSLQHRQQQGPANRTEPKGPRRNYCHREESVSRLRQEQTLRVPGSSLLPMGNDVPFYLSIYSLRCATTPLCYSPLHSAMRIYTSVSCRSLRGKTERKTPPWKNERLLSYFAMLFVLIGK